MKLSTTLYVSKVFSGLFSRPNRRNAQKKSNLVLTPDGLLIILHTCTVIQCSLGDACQPTLLECHDGVEYPALSHCAGS